MLVSITVFLVGLALGNAQSNASCDDVNSIICQDLYNLNPNMCDNSCYSVALCPRFCGKCPLRCYQCHEVASPDQCYTSTQCPSVDHFCITTESFTDDFREVYKLGCALNTICAAHFGPAIGRRADDSSMPKRGLLQGSCCSTDLCNVDSRNATTAPVPAAIVRDVSAMATTDYTTTNPATVTSVPTTSLPVVTSVPVVTASPVVTAAPVVTSVPVVTSAPVVTSSICADVDADICSRLAIHMPGMCSVDCIANDVCPRTCGKCMGCYQCSHVTAAESCTHKTVCARGEQCYAVETIAANLERGYRLGCLNEKLCSTFGEAAPGIFGKRQAFELSLHGGCCTGEFCNDHALLPTTTVPPTTTTVPTTVAPTTTTHKDCPSRYSRCPSGWIHHGSSCYAFSLKTSSWQDAKATCKGLCSTLADFSSSSDLRDVLEDVGYHAFSYAGLSSTTAWVDGRLSHGDWILSNGHEADHTLQHGTDSSDNGKCGSVTTTVTSLSHHSVTTSHHLVPSDCLTMNLPLCEIEHVYS